MGSGTAPSTFCCSEKRKKRWSGLSIRDQKAGLTLENNWTRFATSVASLDLLMFLDGLQ